MPPGPLTVCVLGGSGFVGTEIVTRLVARGWWVRVPTRDAASADHLRVLPTAEIIVANVHDPSALGRAFAGADLVVNLVGILNERGRSGAGFRRAHTELAAHVVAAARTQHVPRLLHMSALGAAATGPSHYLRSKYEAEAQVRAARPHLAWTIFQPSVIFGPRDSLTNRFAHLLRLSRGFLPLARARARFAPIYVGDVAEAFIRSIDDRSTIGHTYELCGPEVMTLADIVRVTASAAGLKAHILPLPDFIGRIQATLFDFVPGKPFSTDNYRSLSIDSVCRESGCARLGIRALPFTPVFAARWLGARHAAADARVPLRPR